LAASTALAAVGILGFALWLGSPLGYFTTVGWTARVLGRWPRTALSLPAQLGVWVGVFAGGVVVAELLWPAMSLRRWLRKADHSLGAQAEELTS
jgi:hypothetical protein